MADRVIVQPGQTPLVDDILKTNLFMYIGLSKVIEAVYGATTQLQGFVCNPISPGGMSVTVGPGQIFSLQNVDNSNYGDMTPTAGQIVKQGIILSTTTLNCPAPVTSGYTINYLIEISFYETDTDLTLRNYYNSADPTQAWSGANGDNTPDATRRANQAVITLKAGVAATTGSQVTPTPDSNCYGAWVVSVPYGVSAITAGMISLYPSAPFIGSGSSSTSYVTLATSQTITAQKLFTGGFNVGDANLGLSLNSGVAALTLDTNASLNYTRSTHTLTTVVNGVTVMSATSSSLSLGSALSFAVDNTYNIGASGANRPATIYVGTAVSINGYNALTSNTGLQKSNNLSDLASISTAQSNMGLGSMATQSAGSVNISGGTITGVGTLTVANASITTSLSLSGNISINSVVHDYTNNLIRLNTSSLQLNLSGGAHVADGAWIVLHGSTSGYAFGSLGYSSNDICTWGASGILPALDNTYYCGFASYRWTTIYAVSGTINTSDATEKTTITPLSSPLKAAIKTIFAGVGTYQWLDAIAKKGADKARLHVGVTAQAVAAAFGAQGLDPTRYGLYCVDHLVDSNGQPQKDANGNQLVRYGVRYDELIMLALATLMPSS